MGYTACMTWNVEYTDEFEAWWNTLTVTEQEAIDAAVGLLIERGPQLGFPHSSAILTSRHEHMRELRIQEGGHPYRTLYAFDPRRTAILPIGGDKIGNDRWYEEYVPIADRLYDDHLQQLQREGLTNG
ncbi:MAG: type II toxin-antitoxin system RelE/ParE family toxin [Azoarcus sp.]|jgi:hypothetical protein|nr:type II toxin-antitoxin system RelE/ParE family toxin [Azoarcus sp.]